MNTDTLTKQLLDIYERYTASPELLADPNIRSAFSLLVKANTKEELRRWQLALVNLGLSFLDRDAIERKDNLMGCLDDTVSRADEAATQEFLLWKRSVTPSAWLHARKCSQKTVRMIEDAVRNDYDAHIVLFRCGRQWAALGADADRLFEIFGWQTGYAGDGDGYVNWMYVSRYGMKVLEESKYSVSVLDLGGTDVVSTAFREDAACAMQQYTDFLRAVTVKSGTVHKELEKELPFIFERGGVLEESSITGYDIDKSRFTISIKPGKKVVIAEGNSWRTDGLGTSLLMEMGSVIGGS